MVEDWLFTENFTEELELPATEHKADHKTAIWEGIQAVLPAAVPAYKTPLSMFWKGKNCSLSVYRDGWHCCLSSGIPNGQSIFKGFIDRQFSNISRKGGGVYLYLYGYEKQGLDQQRLELLPSSQDKLKDTNLACWIRRSN